MAIVPLHAVQGRHGTPGTVACRERDPGTVRAPVRRKTRAATPPRMRFFISDAHAHEKGPV
jgi:hypothetical protein